MSGSPPQTPAGTQVVMSKGANDRLVFRSTKVHSPSSYGRSSPICGLTSTPISPTTTATSRDDYTTTMEKEESKALMEPDFTPSCPRAGEKPNEILQRLYSLWPSQLTPSYRPQVTGNPEATAEFNLRFIRELYPRSKRRGSRRARAARPAGLAVVEAVMHMDKKSHYNLNLAAWPNH